MWHRATCDFESLDDDWTPHDLVLELFALSDIDEHEGRRVGMGVVRLRLPPTMVFDMMLQLNKGLDGFDDPQAGGRA